MDYWVKVLPAKTDLKSVLRIYILEGTNQLSLLTITSLIFLK